MLDSDSSTSEVSYYVRRMGRVEGPWSLSKLRSEVKLRKLGRHHEVSTDGEKWLRAQEVQHLFSSVEPRKLATNIFSATPEPKVDSGDDLEVEPVQGGWYASAGGVERGPMTFAELSQLLSSGSMSLDDLVWREGFSDWLPVEDLPELMHLIDRTRVHNSHTRSGETKFVRVAPSRSVLAVSAFVTSAIIFLLSWIPFVGFLAVLPIGLSIASIFQIKKSNGRVAGIGWAITGLFVAVVSLFMAIFTAIAVGFWWMKR